MFVLNVNVNVYHEFCVWNVGFLFVFRGLREVTQSTIKCGRLAFYKYSRWDREYEGARVDFILHVTNGRAAGFDLLRDPSLLTSYILQIVIVFTIFFFDWFIPIK